MKVIDAENHVLGRLASHVAKMLLEGEQVVIVNAEKAVIIGDRDYIFEKYRKRMEIGSVRKGPRHVRMPDRILRRTVRGMLPYKKPSGRAAYRRLRVYIGVPEEYANVERVKIEDALNRHLTGYVTLGEVAKHLGAKFEVVE